MTSIAPTRDPLADHLLTPQSAALFLIDSPCELQRDRAREETVADIIEIVLTERLLRT